MKLERDDRFEAASGLREFPLEKLQPSEIVGQIDNAVLERVRRLWWRAFDRVCYCSVLVRLSIHDRIHGPEPATAADLQREANQERLVRAFPAAGQNVRTEKIHARQS